MTIDEIMITANHELINSLGTREHVMTTGEIKSLLKNKYQVNEGSAIPSDYCYNLLNKGINPDKKPCLFEFKSRGKYICRGENYLYSGPVFHKGRIVGYYKDGKRILNEDYYENCSNDL